MKRLGRILFLVAGSYLILVLGSGFVIKMLLSKGRIESLVQTLNERVPVKASVEDGSFDLAEWLKFRPVVALRGISVANPPGFSSEPMLTVKEAGAQVSLFSLFGDNVRVMRASLLEPVVNIETDARGNTNMMALVTALSASGPDQGKSRKETSGSQKSVTIDEVILTDGTIQYKGQGAAALTVRDVDLSLSDFGAGRTTQVTLGARLFGGKTSRLDFKGSAGPATEASVPAQGSLSVVILPAEIPKNTRDLYLGQTLSNPPAAAKVTFTAKMQGDAMKTLAGTGALELGNFALGATEDRRLPLSGKSPFRLAVSNPLGMPSAELTSPGSTLQLGGGKWTGTLSARYEAGRLKGESTGSIMGVKIEEMLGAFTTTKNTMSGVAEIPRYQLQFVGKNAAEIQNSLAGGGSVIVRDGKVSLFDLVGTVQDKIRGVLGGDSGKQGSTNFVKFDAKFDVKNAQMNVTELALQDSSSSVTGQGFVRFDHALSFDLTTDVSGGTVAKIMGKGDSGSGSRMRVPVKVRGTLDSPKVYPDVVGLAKTQVVEQAKGLVDSLLKRKSATPSK